MYKETVAMDHGARGRECTFGIEHDDIRVSIYELFKCLGEAMDLVHPGLVDHHKRTAFIAASIANEMALPCEEQNKVLLAALIHDAGAFYLKEKLDVARFDSEDVLPHCMAGYLLLEPCPSLGEIAKIVRHHHVRGPYIRGTESQEVTVPKTSHLLHLADRVAVSLGGASEPLSLGREIVKQIRDESGIMLDPELVQIFQEVAARNAFWFDVTSLRLDQALDGLWRCRGDGFATIDLSEIEYLFSRIIDFRSHFTASHSRGVAAIAERVGQLLGFADGTNRMLCVAGHLHDLGKLAVPTEILEKADSLTQEEKDIIRMHPYHSVQVLRAVDNLHEVKMWCSHHHECLDGSGYPFHLRADDLTNEARILAVSDVFGALCEDRPYRSALPRTEVIRILDNLAGNSKLDRDIVDAVTKHFDDLDAQRREVQKRVAAEYDQFSDSLFFPAFR